MISRTKIIEHYKQHFMFPDNETLSEDYMIDIDWAESLISDLVEKQANGDESKDSKLHIPLVNKSWRFCPTCGTKWTNDCEQFGCWQCGESHVY